MTRLVKLDINLDFVIITRSKRMPFSFFQCCSANNGHFSEDEAGPSTAPVKAKDTQVRLSIIFVTLPVPHAQNPQSAPASVEKQKPYSLALALSLFNDYVDPDTTDSSEPAIGPEGFEKLCSDAQIPLDGALPLLLAWVLDAKEMAKITKDEWIKGTAALQYVLSTQAHRITVSNAFSFEKNIFVTCPRHSHTRRRITSHPQQPPAQEKEP